MKSNGLGFMSEMLPMPPGVSTTRGGEGGPCGDDLEAPAAASAEATTSRGWCGGVTSLSRQSMLCCLLTTALVVTGVGMGAWYIATEM